MRFAGTRGASLGVGITPAMGRAWTCSLITRSSVRAAPRDVASVELSQICGPARKADQKSDVASVPPG